MKAKGIPQYTQYVLCWPTIRPHYGNESVCDRVDVEFNAVGGGCYGSGVTFDFYRWSGGATGLRVSGWTGGIDSLLDDRVAAVLKGLKRIEAKNERAGQSSQAPTPDELIALLEENGIRPSGFQLRALGVARENMPGYVRRTDSL